MDFKATLASIFRPALQPQEQALRAALAEGQQAKFAEDYERALAALERAGELARAVGDRTSETSAELGKSEIYMRQGRYAESEHLNARLLSTTQGDTRLSYINTMVGMVAQSQNDWVTARAAYEQALKLARSGGMTSAEGAEGRALGRLADVYLHDENASYAAHLLREALPKLASAGDVEPSSYFTGLMGQALIASGQDSEGQHLLDRALRLAEQLGYRRYERHWALILGDRAMDEGRYSDAHAHYSHVLRLFKPETTDREYVIAAARMSKASLSLRKQDEALNYARIGLKAAEKIDDAQLLRLAQGALGMTLRALGQSSDAIPHLQAASQDASTDVLRALAAAQADSGDMEAAVITYGRAVQQAEAAGKALEVAQARRDLGLAYGRRGELASAINEWTAALAIYETQHANSQVARLHCDIGNARRALGQRARSMKDYEQALMLVNSLNGDMETRGLILSAAANAYAEQGDAESADAFFTEAITIAEQLGDQIAESTRNGNYGWFLLLVGRPRRAIATLERALNVSQPMHLTLQAAIQLDNLGLVHDSLGDHAAALERHRQALAQVGGSDPATAAWAAQFKVNLANTLIATLSYDEAQTLLDDAVEQGRASGSELLIAALTGQARLALARENPNAAEDVLSEAILLARKLDNRRLLAEALNVRSQQQAALNQDGEAAVTWDEAQRLYLMLHMPQGKQQPLWLTRSATRT